ncbi:MAG: hypothetical protein ABIR08_07480 [Sphingomonas sp.]
MFAAAIAGIAAGARGQATGSIRKDSAPIDVPEGRVTGDAARAVSDNLAFCIVKLHYVTVRKALAPPRNLMNDYKVLPKLMDNDCFSGGGAVRSGGGIASMDLTTNPISFRGGLYKALVRKDYGRRPATYGATALVIEGDDSEILQFADCVVRADAETSRRLLLSVAGTSGEQAAIDAVKPGLAKCAVPNMRMRFSKSALIGDLAEAYYREAEAAKSAGAK